MYIVLQYLIQLLISVHTLPSLGGEFPLNWAVPLPNNVSSQEEHLMDIPALLPRLQPHRKRALSSVEKVSERERSLRQSQISVTWYWDYSKD